MARPRSTPSSRSTSATNSNSSPRSAPPSSPPPRLPYLAEILDAPPPRRVSEEEAEQQIGAQAVYYGTQLRAASNAKAKSALGLALEYPSWREGFRELFG